MRQHRLPTLQDIEAAIWRELQSCVHDRAHAWRTPVLATTDGHGDADARTVVLREVQAETRRLRFFTDARSPKRTQIERQPRGVFVMWSPALHWQLRLTVSLELQLSGAAVATRWSRLERSPAAGDYLSPLPPGSDLDTAAEQRSQEAAAARAPGGHFALVDATVLAIDWLELHAEGQRRARFEADGARWLQP